jgi:hypothetical protein
MLPMTTRLDLALQKYPEHEEGLRVLAARDPSNGKLKYLDWSAKVLASGQALAPEVADVLDLFHLFAGRSLETTTLRRRADGGRVARHVRGEGLRVQSDIYAYRPEDLAKLRDLLLKMKRAQDRKRKKREQLYRIEGSVEADVVFDGPDLVVRHIKNKQASVHYGLNTKWCISMLREGYFEDYETHNATFFFFERKEPRGDEYDKMALMLPRSGNDEEGGRAFTALDRSVDMMVLAKVHGPRVFDILREVYDRSERYPGSMMYQVYAGVATEEQIGAVIAGSAGLGVYEMHTLLEAICCNDAAPWTLLKEIERQAYALSIAASKRGSRSRFRRRRHRMGRGVDGAAKELERTVMAALVIHPATPPDERERLTKALRKSRISVDAIRRVTGGGRVGISYESPSMVFSHRVGHGRFRRRHRRPMSVKWLRERAAMLDRAAKRTRKKARTLARKLAEQKRRKAKAAKVKRARAARVPVRRSYGRKLA